MVLFYKKNIVYKLLRGSILCIMVYVLLQVLCMLNLKVEMGITPSSILNIYFISSNNKMFLVNVIDDYTMDERLYFVRKEKIGFEICDLLSSKNGITDVVDIKIHEWKEKIFVEAAYSTNKGNGEIVLYEVKQEELEDVLTIQGGVDRNLDLTTNTIYANGKLDLELVEKKDTQMPCVIVDGIKLIYGYAENSDFSEEELLSQRVYIKKIYGWTDDGYIECENKQELLQQIEGVEPR